MGGGSGGLVITTLVFNLDVTLLLGAGIVAEAARIGFRLRPHLFLEQLVKMSRNVVGNVIVIILSIVQKYGHIKTGVKTGRAGYGFRSNRSRIVGINIAGGLKII